MSAGIQTTQIKVSVTLDGASFSLSTTVPKNSTSKAAKAAWVLELADQIADFVEMPRKAPRKAGS